MAHSASGVNVEILHIGELALEPDFVVLCSTSALVGLNGARTVCAILIIIVESHTLRKASTPEGFQDSMTVITFYNIDGR